MGIKKRSIYLLSPKKVDETHIVSQPIIDFNYFDLPIDWQSYDAVVFTSKQGVIAANRLTTVWKDKKIFAIGSATAEAVENIGGHVEAIAEESYAEGVVEMLQSFPLLRYLYVRPKKVVSNLAEEVRKYGMVIDEAILYETVCLDIDIHIREKPIVIFTSPSTVECFQLRYPDGNAIIAVALGKKTKSYLEGWLVQSTLVHCRALMKVSNWL